MLPFLLTAALSLTATADALAPETHRLSSFAAGPPAPRTPLVDRVAPMPSWLLEAWRKEDESPAYADHPLSKREKRDFAEAVNGLPPNMRRALEERLLAIYFVENLRGNGITDWVVDESSRPYAYLVLNPAGFHRSLSELLTDRERNPFSGKADVVVDAGRGGSGILYTVSHEFAHAFDLFTRMTPYLDPGAAKAMGIPERRHWDAWDEYWRPEPANDYAARSKLVFYGFGGAPKLTAEEAPRACAELEGTPFTTFYGSRSWAEDAAELFVAWHLAKDLGRPFRIVCGGVVREPLAAPAVAERARRILAPIYGGTTP